MRPAYWEIEEYEDENIDDYNVVVDKHGVPIVINSMRPFLDVFQSKKGLFVLTLDGTLRMGHRLHHSDLMHGQPVVCAGEFRLDKYGSIVSLNNRSGHYMPFSDCLDEVIQVIRSNGYQGQMKIKMLE